MGTQESSFFDLNADRNSDIYVVASDGGSPKKLTTNIGPDTNPEWSPDGNRIVCTIDNSAAPPEVWIINASGNGAGRVQISKANASFDEFAVAKSEAVRWKGPDNFDVEGWITYPLDYQAGKKVPMILS